MRNLSRHNVVVARRLNENNLTDITYYNTNVLIHELSPDNSTFFNDTTGYETQKWIEVYSRTGLPDGVDFIADGGGRGFTPDFTYWDGDWYRTIERSKFIKMGGSSYHRIRAASFGSDTIPPTLTPPEFESEYSAFLDAVGQTTMVVEMAYLPLINKLENL